MKRTLMCIAAAVVMVLVAGCAPAAEAPKEQATPEVETDKGSQLADLGAVDTSLQPSGPTVGEVITAEEVCTILGREDLFLAVPAG